jgi:hypothetical protein
MERSLVNEAAAGVTKASRKGGKLPLVIHSGREDNREKER